VDSSIYTSPFPFNPPDALDRVVYTFTDGDSPLPSNLKVPTPW